MRLRFDPAIPDRKERKSLKAGGLCLLVLSLCLISANGQTSPPAPGTDPDPAPTSTPVSDPVAVERPAEPTVLSDAAAPVVPADESELDPDAEKKDTLERIADSLSERSRALRKRELTLDVREEALSEQEEALALRMRAIMARERALDARENLIGRREKLPPPRGLGGARTTVDLRQVRRGHRRQDGTVLSRQE